MKAKYVCTMSQARKIIGAIWVASFLLAIPTLIVQTHMEVGVRVHAFWCVRDWDSTLSWRGHELYLFVLILLFPSCVMAVAYTAICWEICRVIKRRSYMTSGKGTLVAECYPLRSNKPLQYKSKMRLEEDNQTVRQMSNYRCERQVIKMLVAVVVVFVVCWAPLLVDNLITSWDILPALRHGPLKHMATTFHLLAYFNSCVNPIVYGFMSKSFRESFRKALCCRKRVPKRTLSVSQTRTTSVIRTADTRLYN